MPFELNIAAKYDRAEQPGNGEGPSQAAPCRATVVEVTGELSPEAAVDLIRRLDDVVSQAPSSVVVRFSPDAVKANEDDAASIEILGAWVKRRRDDGCSLYVDVPHARLREAFMRCGDMEASMLPAGADPSVPRRIVH